MHPAGQPPPPPTQQNRSCPSPSLAPCPSPSPSLIQQQQQQQQHQQHVIYGPITTFQPCPTNLHPHCIYTGVQRNPGLPSTSASLTNQGTKWQPKSKPPRGHQHQQQPQHHHHHQQQQQQPNHQPQYRQPITQHQVQQTLSYIPKPLVLFDQCPTNQSTPGVPQPGPSFLVTSSTFANGPYPPGEAYSTAAGLTLIPHQSYFKPNDVPQAFCLLPERPRPALHHRQSLTSHNPVSYYNITSANSCGLQTINSKPGFQLTNNTNIYGNLGAYGTGHVNAVPSGQIFQNPPMTLNYLPPTRDKLLANVDVQTVARSANPTIPGSVKQQPQNHRSTTSGPEIIDWSVQAVRETTDNVFEVPDTERSSKFDSSPITRNRLGSSTIPKNPDERYSDESGTSFDFTIEAEKMVSELCNTASSNDIVKDDNRGRNDDSTSYSGAAGDNVTNKTNIWFADFCTEYGVTVGQNYRDTSTQTLEMVEENRQCTESMRKTIYWGCNEAESILNSDDYRCGTRAEWLGGIARATKTAVTKSSNCFPIFSNDRTFVEDLINAVLRIGNGWLVLDNYLNKQHYPSLSVKFQGDLTRRFRNWESITNELLTDLVRTFVKTEENNVFNGSTDLKTVKRNDDQSDNSITGDVRSYTNHDLFDSPKRNLENLSKINDDDGNVRDATYTLQYAAQSTCNPNVRNCESQRIPQKEHKLRSKWTIAKNLSSAMDGVKSVTDVSHPRDDPGSSGVDRYGPKTFVDSSAKIGSSTGTPSLNAEFFHLRNKVMETMENCKDSDGQRWDVKEQRYDIVFGTSRGSNVNPGVSNVNEPIFKIRTAGTSYENAWTQRCPEAMDSTVGINRNVIDQRADIDGRVYVVSAAETAMDSTYVAAGPTSNRNKTYPGTVYINPVGISDRNVNNCSGGPVVSSSTATNVKTDTIYVGKAFADQRELVAAVPKTKMTLLSQIEGNAANGNRDAKEMTANLSAWFASIRNATGNRAINRPIDGRKNDNSKIVRTSTHPRETSRSAMDLNRQLRIDGNRQLQTLQNMQKIQSEPWNACNLLNNKRGSFKIQHLDEYDSSEDVRVYMKPGSYNVPKKRHHRKNNRRGDNTGSSRIGNNTPRGQNNRVGCVGVVYNSSATNDNKIATSVSGLVISTSVQLSSTATTTTTAVKIPFSTTATLSSTSNLASEDSPGMLPRVRSISNRETRRDVAWKAACASAEILLEALNVKDSCAIVDDDSDVRSLMKNAQTSGERIDKCGDRRSIAEDAEKNSNEVAIRVASSCEASEDDSNSIGKLSQRSDVRHASHSRKQQPRTNVKTDFWLIRTLNNASIVSKINNEDTDAVSTIGESTNDSIGNDRREAQTVVTSTPEPMKNTNDDDSENSPIVGKNLDDSFRERSSTLGVFDSPDRSTSSRCPDPEVSLDDPIRESTGRATYSETVRRSTVKCCSSGSKKDCGRSRSARSGSFGGCGIRSSAITVTGRKSQRKDNDKNFRMLRKSGKKSVRDNDDKDIDEDITNEKIVDADCDDGNFGVGNTRTRRKDEIGWKSIDAKWKTTDRGWSVWYSSRRRQSLSPLALDKLATIHRTVWQMEGAQVLKYPSASLSTVGALSGTIEDYCKIVKSPMFLETIGYKLKNRIYHKVEHVIRDFRRIINNSKLYHKNDTDRMAEVESLSRKLEDLFDEHFSNWDFENMLESPRDDDTSNARSSKCKSPRKQQKSAVNRSMTIAKKNSASCSKNEN